MKTPLRLSVLSILIMSCVCSCSRGDKMQNDSRFETLRADMVQNQLESRNISDTAVLEAMRIVPRHLFVPEQLHKRAYDDTPLPIGFEQTISQPYIVAFMTEALALTKESKVLEIGTGSGYQAAVASRIADHVYSIEIVEPLAERAAALLKKLQYDNISVRSGDGYSGWPEAAPFDAIILTAAPPTVPPPLLDQLAEGGKMVVPVGERYQELLLITKNNGQIIRERMLPVKFVPMTGKVQEDPR